MNPTSPVILWIEAVGAVVGCLSLIWKFGIKPHLERWVHEEIVKPLADVRQMTAKNGGKNDPPTLPDRMHNIEGRADLIEAHLHQIDDHLRRQDEHLRQQDLDAARREKEDAQRWSEHRAWSDAQLAGKANKGE